MNQIGVGEKDQSLEGNVEHPTKSEVAIV